MDEISMLPNQQCQSTEGILPTGCLLIICSSLTVISIAATTCPIYLVSISAFSNQTDHFHIYPVSMPLPILLKAQLLFKELCKKTNFLVMASSVYFVYVDFQVYMYCYFNSIDRNLFNVFLSVNIRYFLIFASCLVSRPYFAASFSMLSLH